MDNPRLAKDISEYLAGLEFKYYTMSSEEKLRLIEKLKES